MNNVELAESNAQLQIACVQMLRTQIWQAQHTYTYWRKKFTVDLYDIYARIEAVLDALRAGERLRAVGLLEELQQIIEPSNIFMNFVPQGLEHIIIVFSIDDEEERHQCLRRLWFELTHFWRHNRDKGVSYVPDIAKFMLIEALATIGLFVPGVILAVHESVGIAKLVPIAIVLIFGSWNVAVSAVRSSQVDGGLVILSVVLGLWSTSVAIRWPGVSDWLYWTLLFAVMTGVAINADTKYKRCRYRASKYGVFCSVWGRKVGRFKYEIVMVDSQRRIVWRRYSTTGAWILDPLLGHDLSKSMKIAMGTLELRNPDPQRPGELNWRKGGQPGGEDLDLRWVTVYPDLTAPRMEGMRRRNPPLWEEAFAKTPGMTEALADEFFAQIPSVIEPPDYDQLEQRPELTLAEKAPW